MEAESAKTSELLGGNATRQIELAMLAWKLDEGDRKLSWRAKDQERGFCLIKRTTKT